MFSGIVYVRMCVCVYVRIYSSFIAKNVKVMCYLSACITTVNSGDILG